MQNLSQLFGSLPQEALGHIPERVRNRLQGALSGTPPMYSAPAPMMPPPQAPAAAPRNLMSMLPPGAMNAMEASPFWPQMQQVLNGQRPSRPQRPTPPPAQAAAPAAPRLSLADFQQRMSSAFPRRY